LQGSRQQRPGACPTVNAVPLRTRNVGYAHRDLASLHSIVATIGRVKEGVGDPVEEPDEFVDDLLGGELQLAVDWTSRREPTAGPARRTSPQKSG
jgi:hypothetical protein